MKPIESITTGPRQSNFELLRIIAMFLVLAVHANYLSLGKPSIDSFQLSPIATSARVFFQALCVMCVNLFVLISGWFGIRPTFKGACKFIFQYLFFFVGAYAVLIILGLAPITLKGIAACMCLDSSGGWFVKAYLLLYIVAPILNIWTDKASKNQQLALLIAFFCYQTFYGSFGATGWIGMGYSPVSFIGLYLLAQFTRRNCQYIHKFGGVIWASSLLLLCAFGIAQIFYPYLPYAFALSSPLVVAEALGFLLIFNGLKIKYNFTINFIAQSAFGVYLLHTFYYVLELYYIPLCKRIYHQYSGLEYFAIITLAITAVFLIAILIDQPRKWLWTILAHMFFKTKKVSVNTSN